jgi:hypothetical protein
MGPGRTKTLEVFLTLALSWIKRPECLHYAYQANDIVSGAVDYEVRLPHARLNSSERDDGKLRLEALGKARPSSHAI